MHRSSMITASQSVGRARSILQRTEYIIPDKTACIEVLQERRRLDLYVSRGMKDISPKRFPSEFSSGYHLSGYHNNFRLDCPTLQNFGVPCALKSKFVVCKPLQHRCRRSSEAHFSPQNAPEPFGGRDLPGVFQTP